MYNLFISHSWAYSDAYEKLLSLLNTYPQFSFKNYSIPKDDPVHNASNQAELTEAIRRQMQSVDCVLILAGVYSSYSKWIIKEVQLAKTGFSSPKKIIAVEPWASKRASTFVKQNADEVVGWNSKSIVKAIRGF